MNDKFQHPIAKAIFPVIKGICRQPVTLSESFFNKHLKLVVKSSADDYRLLRGTKHTTALATAELVTTAGQRIGITAEYLLPPSSERDINNHAFKDNAQFDNAAFMALFVPVCDLVGIEHHGVFPFFTDGKLRVYVPVTNEQRPVLDAINNLFFCWGFTNGRKISIKPDER